MSSEGEYNGKKRRWEIWQFSKITYKIAANYLWISPTVVGIGIIPSETTMHRRFTLLQVQHPETVEKVGF